MTSNQSPVAVKPPFRTTDKAPHDVHAGMLAVMRFKQFFASGL